VTEHRCAPRSLRSLVAWRSLVVHPRTGGFAAFSFLLLALLAPSALGAPRGDTVILNDGGRLDGVEVTRWDFDDVRVRSRAGDKKLTGADILLVIPGNAPADYGRAEASRLSGRWQEAAALYEKAASLADPVWAKPLGTYYAADCRRLGGENGEAVKGFEAFLAAFPKHLFAPAAQYGLGEALLADGKADAALAVFEKMGRAYGDRWEFHGKLGKGLCHLAKKSYTAALTELEIVISNSRGRSGFSELLARASVAKGKSLMDQENFGEAISFYEGMIRGEGQSAPGAAMAYVNLAKCYERRSSKEDDKRMALQTYIAVTVLYPTGEAYPEALYRAAKLLEELGDKAKARAFIDELKARCPQSTQARSVQ